MGRRITAEREVRGMSPDDLAERLGVTKSILHRIEKGRVALTTSRLLQIAGIFGVDVGTLCDGIDAPEVDSSTPPTEAAS